MANNCQIPTPEQYVESLLDYVGYKNELFGKKVLENSCGEGNILCQIVERYIQSCILDNKTEKNIAEGIVADIFAYEIDEGKVKICRQRLDFIAKKYGLRDVRWNLNCSDYLKEDNKLDKMDFIVGNPPYITYHDMTVEQRSFLKDKFETCQNGRYDYCYAFIEKSLAHLATNGKMVYLIPYSVIRNKFANEIRKKILTDLIALYDYEGIKIFDDVISSSVVIYCKKNSGTSDFRYHQIKYGKTKVVNKDDMVDKWFFDVRREGSCFGDFFEVSNSIATLYNAAYLFSDYTSDENYYYLKDGFKLEKQLVYSAVSSRSKKNKRKQPMIIFPYLIALNGKVIGLEENVFKKKYPGVYKYLKSSKGKLDKRKKDKKIKWYEYGRTQALSHVIGEKLIMSMVVTNTVNVYKCDKMDIPYAGYFIKQRTHSELDLNDARIILESPDFLKYVKTHGTPTTTSSFRISVKEIMNYEFDINKLERR